MLKILEYFGAKGAKYMKGEEGKKMQINKHMT